MGEVVPRLWLGSLSALSDVASASRNQQEYWTVISILDSPKLLAFSESVLDGAIDNGTCIHVVWKLADRLSASFLSSELKSILARMDEVMLKNGDANRACLVHCAKGISRSVATVAAWLISRKHLSLAEALDLIRKTAQPDAMPNMGFLASLRALEQCNGDVDKAMKRMQPKQILDVAIIGSGPAGIVSAKTLLGEGISNIMVFEETSCAGGLWNREGGGTKATDSGAAPRIQVPCVMKHVKTGEAVMEITASAQPVYESLTSNFPKDMTSFLGYPFPANLENFPKAQTVADYYRRFGEHFGVEKVTKYHTRVIHCSKDTTRDLWRVETRHVKSGERHECLSNRLLICNGHFRKAFVPYILGIEHFQERMLHSSAFSSPRDLRKSATVLILGGGISGADIAKTLLNSRYDLKVIMSVRNWKLPQDVLLRGLQKNHGLVVRPGIERIDAEGNVHFKEILSLPGNAKQARQYSAIPTNVTLRPDVILFATGYRYHFPFFDDTTKFLSSGGFKMDNLYRRVLFSSDTSLAFVGITNVNFSPAISMEYQARWYAKVVVNDNCRSLNFEMMQKEIKSRRNDTTQDALALKFFGYCNSLAKEAGLQGYWTQLLGYRFPLFLLTTWTRNDSLRQLVHVLGASLIPLLGIGISRYFQRGNE